MLLPAIAVTTGFSAAPAAAALAPPAAAPVVTFVEDFETLDPNHWYAEPRSLTAYTGGAPYLPTYTADPSWLTHCNGTVTGVPVENGYGVYISANSCVPLAYYNAQQLDEALTSAGAVGDAGGNDSLTARTDRPGRGFDPGAGKVQFRTQRNCRSR